MARTLLDNGNQNTNITEEIKSRLKLHEQNTQEIHLNTFGSERIKKETCSQVRFSIDLGDRALNVTVLTPRPVIHSPLSTPVAYTQYSYL